MNDLVDLIGGYSWFYIGSCEVQDFTSSLATWYKFSDDGGGEGSQNDGTLQTTLILSCSSVLRILGG